ncbi:tRNA wybutosine-synthesizing protein 3 homolog isoform X1 [Trichosurus vulpecula]|uniref:tRNA wybutosine-synthesizing protein 3 homolog isoform X1 n=1 Tax=Trichosurus vulpecula TaxID=9337 RepID=UPI00186AD693|nr:tRNA wybutosine-synthesizing protein 3 homolog isoform X1 [Trichosurus vulpecula]
MDRSGEFQKWKAQSLSKVDLSRKGSVDEDVVELVRLLNSREQFFTTSSCAGRILLLDRGSDGCEIQKQNCSWLLVTHRLCAKDDVLSALKKAQGDAVLKFEPFVLHVQCRQLQDAQVLHSVAVDSGFRNSGITVGKRGKTMLAVRSTHGLEVPLSHEGRLMVTEEYIDFLLKIANQKMEENKKRTERFYSRLQLALEREEAGGLHPETKKMTHPVYTHRRKRKTGKIHGQCGPPETQKDFESDEDDAEISLNFFPENY